VAEKNGKANANRKYARSWETFTVEYLGGNKIALKSTHGKYLVAEKKYGKEVNANRKHRKSWETFVVEKQKGGKIALKTAHGLYVVAEKDGRLRADRKKVGSWEKFVIECKGTCVCCHTLFLCSPRILLHIFLVYTFYDLMYCDIIFSYILGH